MNNPLTPDPDSGADSGADSNVDPKADASTDKEASQDAQATANRTESAERAPSEPGIATDAPTAPPPVGTSAGAAGESPASIANTSVVGFCRTCGKSLTPSTVRNAGGTIYCADHVAQAAAQSRTNPVTAGSAAATPPRMPSASQAAPNYPEAAAGSQPRHDFGGAGASYASSSASRETGHQAGATGAGSYPGGSYAGGSYAGGYAPGDPYGHDPYRSAVPPPSAPNRSVSPRLAFALGMIPGVGAIYNGQYAKGFLHLFTLGMMFTIAADYADGLEGLLMPMIPGFIIYMAFEAYHTAQKRRMGLPVDEFSSLLPQRGSTQFPIVPVLLIVVGSVLLLNNLDLLEIEDLMRFWPMLLIALGAYMLHLRMAGPGAEDADRGAVPRD